MKFCGSPVGYKIGGCVYQFDFFFKISIKIRIRNLEIRIFQRVIYLAMTHIIPIYNPLEQFEIIHFIAMEGPLFGYIQIGLTNIGFYLLLASLFLIFLHLLYNREGVLGLVITLNCLFLMEIYHRFPNGFTLGSSSSYSFNPFIWPGGWCCLNSGLRICLTNMFLH